MPCGANNARILHPDGGEMLTGHVGEIQLLGPQIAQGYTPWDHPANIAFDPVDNVSCRVPAYRTGDFGWIDVSGSLFVEGRRDGQVKWNGNRVEIGEIERVVMEVEAVRNAIVLVDRNDYGRVKALRLVVHAQTGEVRLQESIIRHMRARLPAAHVPRIVQIISHMPLMASGKVDRRRLAAELASMDS
jgi:D-alanine--poly(phosphoribitol) ligase subunit 1